MRLLSSRHPSVTRPAWRRYLSHLCSQSSCVRVWLGGRRSVLTTRRSHGQNSPVSRPCAVALNKAKASPPVFSFEPRRTSENYSCRKESRETRVWDVYRTVLVLFEYPLQQSASGFNGVLKLLQDILKRKKNCSHRWTSLGH